MFFRRVGGGIGNRTKGYYKVMDWSAPPQEEEEGKDPEDDGATEVIFLGECIHYLNISL